MLETTFLGKTVRNPFVLASGVWGTTGKMLVRAAEEGAGMVTSKSCSLEPRPGHPNPTVLDEDGLVLNAVGLSNPGVEAEIEELVYARKHAGVPVIASVFGKNVGEYALVAEKVSRARPDFIEVNISCPNVSREGKMFAASPEDAGAVTAAVKRATHIPIIVKLSPNVADIAEIAVAVEAAGADAVCAINTLGGMAIDPVARRPILSNKIGGVSGKLVKPVALKAVYQIRRAVRIPIIGTGGVLTGTDAVEMLMAGANAVGVGSAVLKRGHAFKQMAAELETFMRENGHKKISELKLEE